jgi:hypothetical protein
MTRLLTPLALALAGVTAASVGMAVHRLIADPVLAWMFSGAAGLLDVFKYAAWPVAALLLSAKRRALAGCLAACALLFAGVSGWATFDRVVGAVENRAAGGEQRLIDLAEQQEEGRKRVADLDLQLVEVRRQAAWMRERGMVSKAQELEGGAIARADAERTAALGRVAAAAEERQQIIAGRGAALPQRVVHLLGLGFALALEVVPVLIFLTGGKPAAELPSLPDTELPPSTKELLATQEPVFTGEHAEVFEVAVPVKLIEQKPKPAQPGRDEDLLKALLAGGEELMKVKDFAKAHSIGNTRASAVYKAAEAAGHIRKTAAGYVVA